MSNGGPVSGRSHSDRHSSPRIEGRPCSHLPDSTWAGGGSKTGVDSTALTMRCDSPDQPADCCSANPHDMMIGVIHRRLPSNSGRRNLPNEQDHRHLVSRRVASRNPSPSRLDPRRSVSQCRSIPPAHLKIRELRCGRLVLSLARTISTAKRTACQLSPVITVAARGLRVCRRPSYQIINVTFRSAMTTIVAKIRCLASRKGPHRVEPAPRNSCCRSMSQARGRKLVVCVSAPF